MEVNIRGEEVRALQTSFEVHRKKSNWLGRGMRRRLDLAKLAIPPNAYVSTVLPQREPRH
jgi:hypothetical protein